MKLINLNIIDICDTPAPSGSVISCSRFFPAGHGTFFVGVISFNNKKFTWVYDCGSKRKNQIVDIINKYASAIRSSKIDMLCLSHFDSDHVNGVEYLINKCRVKNLVLPYLPLDQRLKVAFQKKSIDVLKFALDPIGYLQNKGLLERVDKVLLIRGDENSQVSSDSDLDEFPPGVSPSEDDYPWLINGVAGRDKLKEIPGSYVLRAVKNFEFTFFNMPLKSSALKDGVTLAEAQSKIKCIIASSEIDSNKICNLRRCYDEHFGDGSKNRNKISLCVLFRPINFSKMTGFCKSAIYPAEIPEISVESLNCNGFSEKCGLLLTGDISIDQKTLLAMKAHFSGQRWNDIGVFQIPHHGSKHSWDCGSENTTQHTHSVFCVPGRSNKNIYHPHSDVKKALENTNRLYADYSHFVTYAILAGDLIGMSNVIQCEVNYPMNNLMARAGENYN